MSSFAILRLAEERKQWRKNHPFGFFAKPKTNQDGTKNLFSWQCGIPGPKNTPWEGATYKLIMEFTTDYPFKPPRCHFEPLIFHPNVYRTGTVCLSILKFDQGWHSTLTIKQILLHIQRLLVEPNLKDSAYYEPYKMLKDDPNEYWEKIRQ